MLVHGGIHEDSGIEPDELWALSLDGQPVWTPIIAARPQRGHSYPVDAYDPVEDRLLACGGGLYPQTSELSLSSPTEWQQLTPRDPLLSPGGRDGAAVVHDTRRDRFTVLGGTFSGLDSTLWSFCAGPTQAWTPLSSLDTPDFNWFSDHTQAAVYDSVDDRLIVRDAEQVWSTSATGKGGWSPIGPPPPIADLNFADPGFEAGLAYDSKRGRTLITGGLLPAGHAAYGTTHGMWALPGADDLAQWTRIGDLPQVYGSAQHASFYDAVRDRLILVGGIWIGGRFQTVRHYGATIWTTPLDSAIAWTDRTPVSGVLPEGPPLARVACDPGRNRLFLFADSSAWVHDVDDSAPWTPLDFTSARPVVGSSAVYDPVHDQVVALFAQTPGTDNVQAWAFTYGPPSASLVESVVSLQSVALKWQSPAAIGRAAALERREGNSDWTQRGGLEFDDYALATFTDPDVHPGHIYDYRVRVQIGSSRWTSDPVTMAMPAAPLLALLGASPSPAIGRLQVTLTLPDGGPARLDAFDVQGRMRATLDVGGLGPGTHTVAFDRGAALQPGVYWIRLQKGNDARTARVVLMR